MTLKEYLAKKGLSCREFGTLINASAQSVWHYANGKRIPEKEAMKRIIEETRGKVTAGSFYS